MARGQAVDEAEHRFVNVATADKMQTLLNILAEENQRRLVFVKTRRGADRLSAKLSASGIPANWVVTFPQEEARVASPDGRGVESIAVVKS